jgi:hypothetical protein
MTSQKAGLSPATSLRILQNGDYWTYDVEGTLTRQIAYCRTAN